MKTPLVLLLTCALLLPALAANNEREEDRVKESGVVLKEILNIPDDIPQDLLDKAECLVILPSVKKGAFGIGGVMAVKSAEQFWKATQIYKLTDVQQSGKNLARHVFKAVALQTGGNQGFVVRPHRAVVVGEGIVSGLLAAHGASPPT